MPFPEVGLKNTTNIGRIKRGLVVMGSFLDVNRVLNEDKTRTSRKTTGIPTLEAKRIDFPPPPRTIGGQCLSD